LNLETLLRSRHHLTQQEYPMKIKKGFEIRDVCGEKVVIAQGIENLDFSKMINLNESAAYLWEQVQKREFDEAELVRLLQQEYDVDEATAAADVHRLVELWNELGLTE